MYGQWCFTYAISCLSVVYEHPPPRDGEVGPATCPEGERADQVREPIVFPSQGLVGGVVETATNSLESKTGMDLDGDGDVGIVGAPGGPRPLSHSSSHVGQSFTGQI